MFDTVTTVLEWFGLCIFSVTGALVASRKQMDITGFALLGCVTGLGGGTFRDLVLGLTPVSWVEHPSYIMATLIVACLTFFFAHIPQSRYQYLLWFDAVGLALFAVVGAERALNASNDPIIAVAMGVASAAFGGILRDIIGQEEPVVLSREIYITAALAGAVVFVALVRLGVPREIAVGLGFCTGLILRGAGLIWGLSFPRYQPRPGRPIGKP
ncbi:trimeric intracellular cation channel family protein [Consotaella salsifontis]|uniref:Uncharacterized membrane protein YeiH n=1 Tax=Consotaella salsifontis TaxID=1365950 RepID=A0A1T4SXG3_9HYPH|nr:trimeric intracellular cation channel family protein [Consotaella salsifontis]SKA32812.1 Uncharacterized membrane protein YeiH [Consotaella salsifontis]